MINYSKMKMLCLFIPDVSLNVYTTTCMLYFYMIIYSIGFWCCHVCQSEFYD